MCNDVAAGFIILLYDHMLLFGEEVQLLHPPRGLIMFIRVRLDIDTPHLAG
jgi:Family of unknown function (DUF6533)